MILTLGIFGLVLVLIAVLAISYYREGFQNVDPRMTVANKLSASDPKAHLTAPSVPSINLPADHSAAAPIRNDIKPEVSMSDTGYAAMALKQQSDLLSGIQNIVHNELIASRMTQPIVPKDSKNVQSNATAQGHDYNQVKNSAKGNPQQATSSDSCDQIKDSAPAPYQSSMPDMSEYIRKDSIPCWGCSLDY